MDWFHRFMKNGLAPILMITIKLFTGFRTAIDTLIVVGAFEPEQTLLQFINAVIYVLLIDTVFLGLWSYAAYGGDSHRASLLRPYAITAAWILYIGMVIVGWAAHPDSPYLALLSRIAGGVALGYDTQGVIGPVLERLRLAAKERNRARSAQEVYIKQTQELTAKAIKDVAPEMRKQIGDLIKNRVTAELPDVIYGILPTPDEITSGTSNSNANDMPISVLAFPDAVQASWHTCKNTLYVGEVFTRSRIEDCTNLRRSRVGDIISYGMSIGEVQRVGHGRYKYQPIQEAIVRYAEETPDMPKPTEESPDW